MGMRRGLNGSMSLQSVWSRAAKIEDEDVKEQILTELTGMGEKLRKVRKATGMTLHDVAKGTGFCYECLRQYETGEQTPSLVGMLIITAYYGVSLDELFGRDKI